MLSESEQERAIFRRLLEVEPVRESVVRFLASRSEPGEWTAVREIAEALHLQSSDLVDVIYKIGERAGQLPSSLLPKPLVVFHSGCRWGKRQRELHVRLTSKALTLYQAGAGPDRAEEEIQY